MKRIILAAVLCTACLTLGACSGKKGNDAKESTAATETTEAVTEESVEPAKISQDDADQKSLMALMQMLFTITWIMQMAWISILIPL